MDVTGGLWKKGHQQIKVPLTRNKPFFRDKSEINFVSLFPNLLLLSSLIAVDYAVHWHSYQLIVISYSALWSRLDLKILFVNRPYLWSVERLAGLEADKPSNRHLPLKRARGSVRFTVFKASLSSFIIMWDDASVPTDIHENMYSVAIKSSHSSFIIYLTRFMLFISLFTGSINYLMVWLHSEGKLNSLYRNLFKKQIYTSSFLQMININVSWANVSWIPQTQLVCFPISSLGFVSSVVMCGFSSRFHNISNYCMHVLLRTRWKGYYSP